MPSAIKVKPDQGPPADGTAVPGAPSLAQLKALVASKWPTDRTQHWLNNFSINEEQWLCMAMLALITTAERAVVFLSYTRAKRLIGESGFFKDDHRTPNFGQNLKKLNTIDLLNAVDEVENNPNGQYS